MSKNKNYHNYKNYSNNKPQTEEVTPEVQEESTTDVNEETAPVQEEVTTASTPEPVKPTPTVGIVTSCPRLRVRAAASTNADVLCEIESGSEVTIDETKSTKDFYAVCTSAGVEGFCMKKFIVPVK